jgi:sigma-B regulation protein RsbU (phosphoserine phosphatase)
MLQPDIDNCTSTSFRRIFDNLYMHSFKTSEGFIPVVVGVSLVAADKQTGLPDARTYMRTAYDALTRSFDTGVITVLRFGEALPRPAVKS